MSVTEATPEFRIDWPEEPIPWPEGLPPTFSPSQIKLFRKCPEQFRLRYVKGIRTPPQKALLWGNCDHRAAETNFHQKVLSQADLPIDDVLDAFRDAVDFEIDQAGGVSEVNWGDEPAGKVIREIVDDGTRLAGLYHEAIAPKVQPVAVEEWVECELPGITIPMRGRIDVRTEAIVLDRKTTSSSKQSVTPENLLQGRIYAAATGLPTFFHLSVKPKQPGGPVKVLEGGARDGKAFAVYPSENEVTLLAVRQTLNQIGELMTRIGPEDPWPDALAHEWACNYCGFRDKGLCAYWNFKPSER